MRAALFIGQIQAFVEVARLGSMREAATYLYVTQPAITSRLNRLEHELGAALVVRTKGKGVELSDAGRAFLPFAQRILVTLDDAERVIMEAKEATSGDLTVSATPTLCTNLLPLPI